MKKLLLALLLLPVLTFGQKRLATRLATPMLMTNNVQGGVDSGYVQLDSAYYLKYPAAFTFRPFNIYKLNGIWQANKSNMDIINPKIAHMKAYYVNYASGSNSNDGVTPATAVKTVQYAWTTLGARLIYAAPGIYYNDNWTVISAGGSNGDFFVIGAGRGRTFFTSAAPPTLTWTLVSGTTYSTTVTSAKRVVDMKYTNTEADPLRADTALSVAGCEAKPNSSFVSGTTVYVNLSDGRAPDANVLVLTTLTTNQYSATAGYHAAIGITFMGGGFGTHSCIATSTTATTWSIDNNCDFIYGEGANYTSDGSAGFLKSNVSSWIENCSARGNGRDGFNYKAPDLIVKPVAIEMNCISHDNGLLLNYHLGSASVNASSAHDGITVLRVNVLGYRNVGPNFIDVEGTNTLNVGCVGRNSLGYVDSVITYPSFGDFVDGSNTNIPTTMYIVDCTSGDKRLSFGTGGLSDSLSTMIVDSLSTYIAPPFGNTTFTNYTVGNGNLYQFPALSSYTAAPVPIATSSGDAPGVVTGTNLAITLPTVNPNVGAFNGFTVNGKGLVTAAATVNNVANNPTTGAVSTAYSGDYNTLLKTCITAPASAATNKPFASCTAIVTMAASASIVWQIGYDRAGLQWAQRYFNGTTWTAWTIFVSTAGKTITFPATSQTVASLAGTETLTNKTLTTPKLTGYTVSTLPAGSAGMQAYVTDATAPTYLGTLTGGGSVVTPVFYNGLAWVAY